VGSDEFDVVDLGVSDELIDVQQSARSVAVNPGCVGCGVSRRDGVPSHRAGACSGFGCTAATAAVQRFGLSDRRCVRCG